MLQKSRHLLYCVVLVFNFFSLSALAQSSRTGNFTVSETVMFDGQQLPAGRYQVIWSGTGDATSVTVKRGHKVVATAPAHVIAVTPPKDNRVMENKGTDGTRSISEIQFFGEKYALRFDQAEEMRSNLDGR